MQIKFLRLHRFEKVLVTGALYADSAVVVILTEICNIASERRGFGEEVTGTQPRLYMKG